MHFEHKTEKELDINACGTILWAEAHKRSINNPETENGRFVHGGAVLGISGSRGMGGWELEEVTRPIKGLEVLPVSDFHKLVHDAG